jgi:hypothetical protein
MTEKEGFRQIDDLVLHLKGLVLVRALLQKRGASTAEVEAHTREIERVRARLAEVVRSSPMNSAALAGRS